MPMPVVAPSPTGTQQYLIRSIGELRSSADIGNVMVSVNKGIPVLVRDVAEVRVGGAPVQGLVGQTSRTASTTTSSTASS